MESGRDTGDLEGRLAAALGLVVEIDARPDRGARHRDLAALGPRVGPRKARRREDPPKDQTPAPSHPD